jgi:hypothetical protein
MFSAILWSLPLLCGVVEASSYLIRAASGPHGERVIFSEPYVPKPGDLVFYDCEQLQWDIIDFLSGTGPPDHMGIVVARPDGNLAVLEAGPDKVLRVFLLDIPTRFEGHHGGIYVRRLRCPLTPEQSAALTDFALAQEGKRYALFRFLRQITPFKARGPIRSSLFGMTKLNREHWFCSELVVAAGTVAGLFNPNVMNANNIYPYDILDDTRYDLSDLYEEAAVWSRTPSTAPPRLMNSAWELRHRPKARPRPAGMVR